MDLIDIFNKGLELHHYANTAYPLKPISFKQFKITEPKSIEELLQKGWNKVDEMAFYVHIPFCEKRCKFCEYVVLSGDDKNSEDEYISLLLREIEFFSKLIDKKKVIGYDMGGGTPLFISTKHIEKITNSLFDTFNFNEDVGLSIETTPVIAAHDLTKLQEVHQMGYKRISMGIQTINSKLLESFNRKGSVKMYAQATENIRKAGYKRYNLDLMYGFLNQKNTDFEATVKFAISLNPEYITLYRNRYKGTKLEHEAKDVELEKVNKQYDIAFELLNANGYIANSGKNTFSRVQGDYGTSEYLTKRVIEGTPYLGLGLGAQSMGENYLSYNEGAASKQLNKYKEKVNKTVFPIQDIYDLPLDEMAAKMVSVSFYFGFIDSTAFQKRFKVKFEDFYKDEIDFLQEKGLMQFIDNRFTLSSDAKNSINGIIPLFYSNRSKKELIEY